MRRLISAMMVVLSACGVDGADANATITETSEASTAEGALGPRRNIPLTFAELYKVGAPVGSDHEALPAGVPASYDWYAESVLHAGNNVPKTFTAVTGWGQAFWAAGAQNSNQAIMLRNTQTLMCLPTQNAAAPTWVRIQNAGVEGAAFVPDYVGNVNVPAVITQLPNNEVRVSFGQSPYYAFHWWPNGGRAVLPSTQHCGILFLYQARAVQTDGRELKPTSSTVNSDIIIGGGADYWLSVSAPWDNYLTNAGLGTGQLRRVTNKWQWFGYSTATPNMLFALKANGFHDL